MLTFIEECQKEYRELKDGFRIKCGMTERKAESA